MKGFKENKRLVCLEPKQLQRSYTLSLYISLLILIYSFTHFSVVQIFDNGFCFLCFCLTTPGITQASFKQSEDRSVMERYIKLSQSERQKDHSLCLGFPAFSHSSVQCLYMTSGFSMSAFDHMKVGRRRNRYLYEYNY